jgi:hypothetical protein
MEGVVFAADENGGHLVYRTRTMSERTPDLIYVLFSEKMKTRGKVPVGGRAFDEDPQSAEQRAVFFYAHGLCFASVKDVVEYVTGTVWPPQVAAPVGWVDWLMGRSPVEGQPAVVSVTVCCFDIFSHADVRVCVDFRSGRVTEHHVTALNGEVEQTPDMRAVAASQLIRLGKCGLSFCPLHLGIPASLIDMRSQVPQGAALAFCRKNKAFVKQMESEYIVALLQVPKIFLFVNDMLTRMLFC